MFHTDLTCQRDDHRPRPPDWIIERYLVSDASRP
jgi:hypothetical protein